ncbi:MAG: argininosuccinate lyase [Spirochaetales bacterium]|nr:argininosuccinate lyase [Spirochaetales bacterium]
MAKLWHKNYELNELVEAFTVGEDFQLDINLVGADCAASLAHAHMLETIGILSKGEYAALKKELLAVIEQADKGKFSIQRSMEDCHTAIENYLVKQLGDTGKKIHTGRSRNDQIIAALRLYARDFLLQFHASCTLLIRTLLEAAKLYQDIPMPGRTHMQIAMPSSVGLWALSFAEQLLDDLCLIDTAYKLNDMCPLGSAASYGVPLPLDRELVAKLLGFSKLQNNVLYVNNSRGKIESIIIDALEQTVLTLSKLAQDLILFSMPEFGYFTLPQELCSGSSIMPQKKNPCALELVRAKSASLNAYSLHIKAVVRALPSGYNRDFQETKAPFMRGINTALACVEVMSLSIQKLKVNEQNLLKGFIPEIYATDAALELVKKGVPFRDAYKEIGLHLDNLKDYDPKQILKAKTATGNTGNLCYEKAENELKKREQAYVNYNSHVENTYKKLLGKRYPFFKAVF